MQRSHSRTIGVTDFLRWHDEKTLTLSPKFQRRLVWPPKARAFLIDTILRGMPIPKLFMRQHLDMRGAKAVHEIVDGQQRLAAVLDFRKDEVALSQDHPEYPGAVFSKLPREVQKTFLTYEFSVDLLVDAADADVLDIFARINSYSVPLNRQEKRNARFFGSFKTMVYALGFRHLEFWKKHQILTDAAIARMKEAELVSELVVAMAEGLQDKKTSLDGYYKRWDDRFPYRKKSIDRFADIIDLLEEHLGSDISRSNFRRPPLFYSLFLAVYEQRYGTLGDFSGTKRSLGDAFDERLRRAITKLDEVLDAKSPPDQYRAFVLACQRQTDNLAPRGRRRETILTELSRPE